MQELREGRATEKQAGPEDGTVVPDLMLIGSVKGKLEWASPVEAKNLYVSTLWRCRRRYAEQSGIPWYILSAKYGLVNPDTRIAWYDVSLSDLPAADRRVWSQSVVDSVVRRYPSVEGMVVEIHAGMDYVNFGLASGLADAGMIVHRPLLGIPIGRHLAWYKEHGVEA